MISAYDHDHRKQVTLDEFLAALYESYAAAVAVDGQASQCIYPIADTVCQKLHWDYQLLGYVLNNAYYYNGSKYRLQLEYGNTNKRLYRGSVVVNGKIVQTITMEAL